MAFESSSVHINSFVNEYLARSRLDIVFPSLMGTGLMNAFPFSFALRIGFLSKGKYPRPRVNGHGNK